MYRALPSIFEDAGVRKKTFLSLRGNVWLVDAHGTPAVLRRVSDLDADSMDWEQQFLTALIAEGFPAPRPIALFDGRSWVEADGAIWKLDEYLKGEALGWRGRPTLQDAGRFIARYHDTVLGMSVKRRPGFSPLHDQMRGADPAAVEGCLGSDDARTFWVEADRVCRQLEDGGHLEDVEVVIHGDFHCENMLIAGNPPAFVGAIDFGSAHHDPALVDLAFSLWRTCRSNPADIAYDLERMASLATGYMAARGASQNQVLLLPTYLVARGLVLIAKWSRQGLRRECQIALERVRWMRAHPDQVAEAIMVPGVR